MSQPEKPQNQEDKSLGQATKDAFKEVVETFVHLVKAPRALWGINISYLMEGLAYFGVLTILGIYLAEDVGLKESQASLVLSFLTGGITLAMLLLGGVSDRIGVRKALLISLGFMILGRFFLAASGTFFPYGEGAGSLMFASVLLGLLLVVIGYGMYQPAAYAGVKQFTNKKTAAIGYAMIYALMNLGAFFSGIISPPIRHATGMVGVYWVYVGMTVAAFLSVLFILTRRTADKASEQVKAEDDAFDEAEGKDAKEKTEDGSADKAAPGEAKAEQRSLLNTPTLLLGALFLGAVATFTFMYITAPTPPLQATCEDLAGAARRAAKGLEENKAQGEALRSVQRKAADRITPTPGAENVEELAFFAARRQFKVLSPTGLARAGEKETLPPAMGQRVRGVLRVHAVKLMACAYRLVAPVDAQVLESLRLRLKEVEEETVHMNAEQETAVMELTERSEDDMLRELSSFSKVWTTQEAEGLSPLLAESVTKRLQADGRFYGSLASRWKSAGTMTRHMLSQTLLADSLFYRDLANSLVELDAPEKGAEFSDSAFWAMHLESKAALLKDVYADALQAASPLPAAVRYKRIALRYGTSAIPALILLIVLVWWLLKLRPDHPFHNSRFTFFIFILIPVQTLFAHNWLTLPFYINRAFAGTTVGENFEFFSNINPVLIFFLTPLVAAMTSRARVYPMMIAGTLVMALPTFLLALPPNPVLLMSYILLMSIGEAMWQPRFLQLVAEIAPEGKTGAYMGIAQLPWFMTKVFVGFYAGWFVANYCPSVGPQNTEFMWLIYAIIAMLSPLGLWLAKGWIGSTMEKKAA